MAKEYLVAWLHFSFIGALSWYGSKPGAVVLRVRSHRMLGVSGWVP